MTSEKLLTIETEKLQSRLAPMAAYARGVLASAANFKIPGRVLGIDLALRFTGLVLLSEFGHVLRCVTIADKRRSTKKGDVLAAEQQRIERILNVANEILGYAKLFEAPYIAIEGAAYNRVFQAFPLGEMTGVVKTQLWLSRKVVPFVVAPTAGRKYLFGNGQAAKDDVFSILRHGLDLPLTTDHEADAYVSARYYYQILVEQVGERIEDPEMKLPQLERRREAKWKIKNKPK